MAEHGSANPAEATPLSVRSFYRSSDRVVGARRNRSGAPAVIADSPGSAFRCQQSERDSRSSNALACAALENRASHTKRSGLPVHVIAPTTSPVTPSMIEHGSIGLIQQFGAGTDANDVGAATRPCAAGGPGHGRGQPGQSPARVGGIGHGVGARLLERPRPGREPGLGDQPELASPGDSFGAVGRAELAEHVGDVLFDGVEGDHQVVSDPLVRQAGGEQFQHLHFA